MDISAAQYNVSSHSVDNLRWFSNFFQLELLHIEKNLYIVPSLSVVCKKGLALMLLNIRLKVFLFLRPEVCSQTLRQTGRPELYLHRWCITCTWLTWSNTLVAATILEHSKKRTNTHKVTHTVRRELEAESSFSFSLSPTYQFLNIYTSWRLRRGAAGWGVVC